MDLPADRVPELGPQPYEPPPSAGAAPEEQAVLNLHREINARRAQVENPEMLRRLRSL